jgi:TetR/AcrR family transcriptional regulator, tetracycline repressor protein
MARTATSAPRAPLSRERVVGAALALVDRDGLEALSMRRLAAQLGVEAMSLYHHVRDKADVLDGLVAAVLDEMRLPGSGPWDDRVMEVARELRRVVRAHPNVHTLVVERAFRSPSVLAPVAVLLDALGESGLDQEQLAGAFWTLLSFVSGSLSCELADVPEGLDQLVDLPVALFDADLDAQFERGLRTVTRALTTE